VEQRRQKSGSSVSDVLDTLQRQNARYPGYLIRRLQQISSSIILSHLRTYRITPIQHTLLRILQESPDIDQRSLATLAALDASTTTDVLARLVARKLVSRSHGRTDKRTRVVRLTKAGERMVNLVKPHIQAAQQELLGPLDSDRQRILITTLLDLIDAHDQVDAEGQRGPWRRFR
jgi:DNA-binding MarR family transcriptional regulator